MHLTVPTSFDPEFVEAIKGRSVRFVYGSLPDDPSARQGHSLPRVDLDGVAAHIERCRSAGVGFIYALNAACSGNAEFTSEGQKWLAHRLGWLVDVGASGVVTANPYLMELVRRRFPELRVHVSSLVGVDTTDKAMFFQDLGAAAIYFPEHVNRDFKLLKAIKRTIHIDAVLMVNLACLLHCPIHRYHANCVSHAAAAVAHGCYLDYSLATCTRLKATRESELLKAPWIRPEDLAVYEDIGLEHFKIAGREQRPGWLASVIDAYARRRYPGPLNDLIGLDAIEPFGTFPVTIDNRRLDGFLRFFTRKDCRPGCDGCTHCQDWARKAAIVDPERDAYVERIDRFVEPFTRGAFRAGQRRTALP